MSMPSKHIRLLLTLGSELALLLVARGESETLIGLPLVDPDRALCTDDAGMFVIRGRKLFGMLLRMSCVQTSHLRFSLNEEIFSCWLNRGKGKKYHMPKCHVQ
jgi:hypothetical protein